MSSKSIRTRLGIAFGLLILILVSVGRYGDQQIWNVSSQAQDILEKKWGHLHACREAMQLSSENSRLIMEVFLLGNGDQIQSLLKKREQNSERITELIASIKAGLDDDPQEQELFAATMKARKEYVESYQRDLSLLLKDGNVIAARNSFEETTIPLQVNYHRAWNRFADYQEKQAADASVRARSNSRVACHLFSGMVTVAVALAIGIAFWVTRGMTNEVKRRLQVEVELRQAGEKLEERVEQRTNELVAANRELQDEVANRKKAQEELAQERERFQVIFETSPEGLFQSTPDGHIICANPALLAIFGYGCQEEMLQSIQNIATQLYADPSRRTEFRRRVEAEEVVRDFEAEIVCRDQSRKWVSITACSIRKAGEVAYYQGFMVDITASKLAQNERNLMEIQLRHAQKLESVGQLAAGIAHEINTPIQYVGDNLRFMNEAFGSFGKLIGEYEKLAAACKENAVSPAMLDALAAVKQEVDFEYLNQEIPQAIQQSLEGAKRVTTIVCAMKEFSHPGSKEKVLIDINHAIETTLTVARNEWKYVADAKADLAAGLPRVLCLPDEFNQVVLNLIINAAHAIGDVVKGTGKKGLITIATRLDEKWVEVRVSDTGTGIPEEIRHRIFEPFFTTKEVGKGTGQGLAIARSTIVNRHGGDLGFESAVGKGTTFIIRMPVDAKID